MEEEFSHIYIFNLRGDARTQGETRQKEAGNIFDQGSRAPIAIIFLIKASKIQATTKQAAQNHVNKAEIYYYDIGDYLSKDQKLNIITRFKSIENLPFAKITPNKDYDWINQRDYSYLEFVPIANKKLKEIPLSAIKSLKNKDKIDEEVFLKGYVDIFEMYSQGVLSSRDAWCFNFSKQDLEKNMSFMIENYNGEVVKKENNANYKPIMDKDKINWSRDLRKSFDKDLKFDFHKEGLIVECLYRPFTKCHLYLAKHFNEMLYQMPQIYPATQAKNINILDCQAEFEAQAKQFFKAYKYLPNLTICISGIGADDFSSLISNQITELAFMMNSQCFPLYYYEKIENLQKDANLFSQDGKLISLDKNEADTSFYKRKDAIRDETLDFVRGLYKDEKISKEDIFYYIYGLLNHKVYKDKYKDNLSKMLPRIPFVRDFRQISNLGRDLSTLHLSYENYSQKTVAFIMPRNKINEAGPLFWNKNESEAFMQSLKDEDFTFEKMRFLIKGRKDRIIFNDKIALTNIPLKAYEFVVNGKSAIEWIMERYQVKIDKESGIKNDPNLYECENGALKGLKGGKYILNLLLSVVYVSVETVQILEKLSQFSIQTLKKIKP